MSTRRTYDNSRRAAQADRTTRQILDATIALLGRADEELSVPAIAREAGVSAPTVTKYFPNRQAIFEAVQTRINDRFGRPSPPDCLPELRASIPHLHRFFAEQEAMVRAVVTAPQLRAFWEATRKRREAGLQKALREVTAHLPKDEATAIAAIIIRLIGAEGWLDMKDHWRLDDDTIITTTLKMLNAILADLAKGARAAGKDD